MAHRDEFQWSTLNERVRRSEQFQKKAVMLAQDAESLGGLSDMLGVDRVIALAQVYATLSSRV